MNNSVCFNKNNYGFLSQVEMYHKLDGKSYVTDEPLFNQLSKEKIESAPYRDWPTVAKRLSNLTLNQSYISPYLLKRIFAQLTLHSGEIQERSERTKEGILRFSASQYLDHPVEVHTDSKVYLLRESIMPSGSRKEVGLFYCFQTGETYARASINCEVFGKDMVSEVKNEVAAEVNWMQKFQAEPTIVTCYGQYRFTNFNGVESMAIMMEYCPFGDLEQILDSDNPIFQQSEAVWNIAEDLFSALTALHTQEVHHRDVKLENIFVVWRDGRFHGKLGDFGAAQFLADERWNPSIQGTISYHSPEWVEGARLIGRIRELADQRDIIMETEENESIISKYDEEIEELHQRAVEKIAHLSSDIWAAGIVLFNMRTHHFPFWDSEDSTIASHNIRNLHAHEIEKIFPIPGTQGLELAGFNGKLLAYDREKRPTAADALQGVKYLRSQGVIFA